MTPLSRVTRKTKETEVELELELDGRGNAEVQTGIPFLDHMLHLFAAHGYFDLKILARGDLHVDQHHTVEDIGICLGQAVREALSQRPGVRRFGDARVDFNALTVDVRGTTHRLSYKESQILKLLQPAWLSRLRLPHRAAQWQLC